MGKRTAQVNTYIANSAEFARPILEHIRTLVHTGCPDIQETVKWGFPHFMYKGILCSMASFKRHCAFGFWKGKLVIGKGKVQTEKAMGQFGRITSLKDLPNERTLLKYIRKAVAVNDAGIKSPTRSKTRTRKKLEVPDDLGDTLRKNRLASIAFHGFNYSHKKEYIEWISGAKKKQTRSKRLARAVQWMSEGKVQNWKRTKE